MSAFPKQCSRVARVALSRVRQQPLEAVEVELAHPDRQRVTRPLGSEHVPAERSPQFRSIDLHHLRRRRRWLAGPEIVDQALGRNDLVGTQQKDRQQRALSSAPESENAVVVSDLEGTEDSEVHRALADEHGNARGFVASISASAVLLDPANARSGRPR